MSTGFSEDEVQEFESLFATQDHWRSWRRCRAEDGRDVLEVQVGDTQERKSSVRLTKVEHPRSYMAAGLRGWSLVVCSSFDELMATLSNRSQMVRQ